MDIYNNLLRKKLRNIENNAKYEMNRVLSFRLNEFVKIKLLKCVLYFVLFIDICDICFIY